MPPLGPHGVRKAGRRPSDKALTGVPCRLRALLASNRAQPRNREFAELLLQLTGKPAQGIGGAGARAEVRGSSLSPGWGVCSRSGT